MTIELIRLLFAGLLSLSVIPTLAEEYKKNTPIVIDDDIPIGFEDLNQPQKDVVDVYFGGELLLSTVVTYTQETLTFSHPNEIVKKINSLLDKTKTAAILSKELAINADKVCIQQQKNCGRLAANETGVIFNADLHKLDLFLGKALLAEQQVKDKFLPLSNTDLSFSLPFSLITSGNSNKSTNDYSLNGDLSIAKGNTHLTSIWNYSQNNFQARNLYLRRDAKGIESRIGLFDTIGFGGDELFSNQFVAGVRYAATTLTRTDLNIAIGSRLSVLLNSRSRIDIIKEGITLASAEYDAGNHLIDTSSLPDGSYDVILRIQDLSGQVREEQHFFSKSHLLPPIDQPLYFFEGGQIYDKQNDTILPQSSNHWIVRGGYSQRINNNFGARAVATATNNQTVIGLSSLYLGTKLSGNASVLFTDTADYAYGLSASIPLGKAYLSASTHKVNVKNKVQNNGIQQDTFKIINDSLNDISINLNLPIAKGSIRSTYNIKKRQKGLSTELQKETSWGVGLFYPLLSRYNNGLNLVANVERTVNGNNFFIGLQYNFSTSNWNHNIKYGRRKQTNNIDASTDETKPLQLSSSWNDVDVLEGLRVDFSYNSGEQENQSALATNVDYKSDNGSLHTYLNYQKNDNDNQENVTNYNLTFSSNIVGNTQGVAWGGSNREESAVVVKIDSNEVINKPFDVRVNNQHQAYVDNSTPSVVGLIPYNSYDIAVYPPIGENYNYKISKKHITAYPGNIETISLKVFKTHSIYGEVLDIKGEPLKNASIKNSKSDESSDEFGIFQAEITTNIKSITFIKENNTECTVKLPALLNVKKIITLVGKLTCN